jgi:hypothetical protein
MNYRNYSDKELIAAVKSSNTICQVLRKIGLKPAGGNYYTIRQKIKKLNLDTSHFTGQAWSKGKKFGNKRPLEDYFSNRCRIHSHDLRLRLIKDKVFDHKCCQCGLTEWNHQPIPLELEHKDGDHYNNQLSNLTILCPNCHAQTSTHAGKNKGKYNQSLEH